MWGKRGIDLEPIYSKGGDDAESGRHVTPGADMIFIQGKANAFPCFIVSRQGISRSEHGRRG